MASENSKQELMAFLEERKKLNEIETQVAYLKKLLEEAHKKLPMEMLENLSHHISKLSKKLEDLLSKKKEIENTIQRIAPAYYNHLKLSSRIIEYFKRYRLVVLRGEVEFKGFLNKLQNLSEKIFQLLESLENDDAALKEMLPMVSDDTHKDILLKDLEAISGNLHNLRKIAHILTPPLEEIKRAWKLVGFIVYGEEGYLGHIIRVYLEKRSFEILLEIQKEREINEVIAEQLFKEIGVEFGTRSVDEFLDALKRELQRSGKEPLLIPSLIKIILEMKNLPYSHRIEKILAPNYDSVGFIKLSKLGTIDLHRREIKISAEMLIPHDKIDENDLVLLPSITKMPPEILFRPIKFRGINYEVFQQTIIPRLGHALILLRRDEKREPLPHVGFLKRVLLIIKRARKKLLDTFGITARIEKLKDDDIYWLMRLLIVRGLSDVKNVTESNALRSSILFNFCLRFGIPILYEEILQSYFAVIETSNVIIHGNILKPKVDIDPPPLLRYFNYKELARYLPKDYKQLLGVSVRRDGIFLHCAKELSEDILERKIREYSLPPQIKSSIENDAEKLLRALILMRKLKSIEEYTSVKKQLEVAIINYETISNKFKDVKEIVQRILLEAF